MRDSRRPSSFTRALLAGLLLATTLANAERAPRRCTTPQGQVIHTDQRCDAVVGTADRAAPAAPRPTAGTPLPVRRVAGPARSGCARTPDALLWQVNSAMASGDGAGLVAVYHWTGLRGDAAYALAERLAALATRHADDVSLVYPQPAARVGDVDYAVSESGWPIMPDASAGTARALSPIGLRIARGGSTPAVTRFALRRHMECWWISY